MMRESEVQIGNSDLLRTIVWLIAVMAFSSIAVAQSAGQSGEAKHSGTGSGNGLLRPGAGGVGYPSCLDCPDPQYSENARKAKYQGMVLLQALIEPDGQATNIMVVKGPGLALGLEEKAVEAVRRWRFKPALGPKGTPVATIVPIEVIFRLPGAPSNDPRLESAHRSAKEGYATGVPLPLTNLIEEPSPN
jgi:TonB family protein